MNLSKEEIKLLKNLNQERKAETKKTGSYLGYVIPYNHPDNELTPKQKALFDNERKIARKLVKKQILSVVCDDRRIAAYDLVEDDNA